MLNYITGTQVGGNLAATSATVQAAITGKQIAVLMAVISTDKACSVGFDDGTTTWQKIPISIGQPVVIQARQLEANRVLPVYITGTGNALKITSSDATANVAYNLIIATQKGS